MSYWTAILPKTMDGVSLSGPIWVLGEIPLANFPPRQQPPVSMASVSFNPQEDLPNPRPGDLFQGNDGSLWYASDNNTWAEYTENNGVAFPTGRVIDVRDRGLSNNTQSAKELQNSTEKARACPSLWDHKWATYIGLTGINQFEYCELCGKKKDEV
jgi:hypothetical protein